MRTGESPIGALYIAAMLLKNLRNYVYPNSISQYTLCAPPTLEDYLDHKQQQNACSSMSKTFASRRTRIKRTLCSAIQGSTRALEGKETKWE